jgi:hypothetical protein
MSEIETQVTEQETAIEPSEQAKETAKTTETTDQTNGTAKAAESTEDIAAGADIVSTDSDAATTEQTPEEPEEISYHTVEKDGHVGAIWEMQGRKHLRTIDPRSQEGKHILSLFTSDHHEEESAAA